MSGTNRLSVAMEQQVKGTANTRKGTTMSNTHELEQLLANLVVTWPADESNPALEAARNYLQVHCNIAVESPTNGHSLIDRQSAFEELTLQWYSV